jgi:hypothetical protein
MPFKHVLVQRSLCRHKQQVAGVDQTTAQNNHFRIKRGHQVRKHLAEMGSRDLERLLCK